MDPDKTSSNVLGCLIGSVLGILEVAGLITGFTKSLAAGLIAVFIPPYAWWLGLKWILSFFG